MMLSSLTGIGFEVNAVMSECPDFELTLEQVHGAARERRLIPLLKERFQEGADFSLLLSHADELAQVEAALGGASEALEGRESRKVGIRNSGLCLVIALVFEAIQQRFCPADTNHPH